MFFLKSHSILLRLFCFDNDIVIAKGNGSIDYEGIGPAGMNVAVCSAMWIYLSATK